MGQILTTRRLRQIPGSLHTLRCACAHTHMHKLSPQGSREPKCTQTFCQTASKTMEEAPSKAPMALNSPLFSPIFLLMSGFYFHICVSPFALLLLPPPSQASQGIDRAELCHLSLSAASLDLEGGTVSLVPYSHPLGVLVLCRVPKTEQRPLPG